MRKIFYLLLVGLVPFLASCDKETTYTINKSGSLTIKVVDSDGNGVDNAKIDLRLSGETLFYDSTDVSGVYKSEEMLEGIYRCYVSVTRNGLVYNSNQYVQVIAGENKRIEVNPFGNSKNITIGLSNYYNDAPISANVLICPRVNVSLDEYKELAYFSGKTTNGQFSVDEVPYGSYYVVFYDDNDKTLGTNEIYVSKDSQSEYKSYVYVSTITVKLLNYYNDEPIATPYNALIAPSWRESLEEYKQHAVAQGKTNTQGTVVFENIVSSNNYSHYRIIIYDDNNNIVKDESVYVEEHTPVFKLYIYVGTIENSGKLNLTFVNSFDNEAILPNLDFGIMLEDDYYDIYYTPNSKVADYVAKAHFLGKTNSEGKISFSDFPADVNYVVFVYKGTNGYYVNNHYVYLLNGENKTYTIRVNFYD